MPSKPDQREPTSPWLKPDEAAEYLGIALGTLRNWTSAKFVPHAKRSGIVRYHRGELDKWMLSRSCKGRATFANALDAD